VRGYDKDGKQMFPTRNFVVSSAAVMYAKELLGSGCKSVDIDLIESSDELCGT
jgi:hypothetical protein